MKCIVYITCKQKAKCGDEKTKTRCVSWPLGKLAGYDLARSSKVGCGDCATINDYLIQESKTQKRCVFNVFYFFDVAK